MNKTAVVFIAAAIAVNFSEIRADNSMANQIGVGARALSFANNYVAAANDMSSIYWNPAALSFLPVREAQVSFDALTNTSTTDYYGTMQTSAVRRLRVASAGFLSAIPTSKGGLTFAAAFQSPVVFERNPSFHGTVPSTAIFREDNYRGFGGLNYWSGAFGIQVAPGLGIGVSPSFVSGRETIKESWLETNSGAVTLNGSDNISRTYLGYDLRAGVLYSLMENSLRIGGRLVFPQTIWFKDNSTYSGSFQGELTSSFSGAIGAAEVFPIGTFSTEVRFRAPYDYIYPADDIPESSPASDFKNGAGIGVEIPVLKTNALVRFGYSWDEFDLYQYAMQYNGEPVGAEYLNDSTITGWGTSGIELNNNRQNLTLGIAYVTSSISFEASYGYQFWNITTNSHRNEDENLQRVLACMSVRF